MNRIPPPSNTVNCERLASRDLSLTKPNTDANAYFWVIALTEKRTPMITRPLSLAEMMMHFGVYHESVINAIMKPIN